MIRILKYLPNVRIISLALITSSLLPLAARADMWRTGYYPGWEQSDMPASNIDFTTLSHIIHFSLAPNPDGSVDSGANSITSHNSTDVVTRAHAAGAKVIICVGGGGTESDFQGATSAANLPVFINNLTNFMATRGYDGIDIDWEPLPISDAQQYTNFVNGLRSALDTFPSHKLLTAAVGAYPPYGDPVNAVSLMFAQLQSEFDQINVMSYDLSGPYDGWVTWFNSPIYDGGYRFPSNGNIIPSLDGGMKNFIANGVAPSKLGVSLAFYGYLWTGGSGISPTSLTGPRQQWTIAPTITGIGYSDIMATYYQSNLYHWDGSAQSAYLSITNANKTNNIFISYDDPRACQAKVSYARSNHMGGVFIWELAQDHVKNQPDPLMVALKQALATPGELTLQNSGADAILSFNTIALGSYRVQWSSDPATEVWNSLLVTNISDAGGLLQITDFGAATNQPQRFYRIQTPP